MTKYLKYETQLRQIDLKNSNANLRAKQGSKKNPQPRNLQLSRARDKKFKMKRRMMMKSNTKSLKKPKSPRRNNTFLQMMKRITMTSDLLMNP